jgi:hypothetical protein
MDETEERWEVGKRTQALLANGCANHAESVGGWKFVIAITGAFASQAVKRE